MTLLRTTEYGFLTVRKGWKDFLHWCACKLTVTEISVNVCLIFYYKSSFYQYEVPMERRKLQCLFRKIQMTGIILIKEKANCFLNYEYVRTGCEGREGYK